MTFPSDLPAAARRHLEAADILDTRRRDVAGYLYGIAAECAIKAMLIDYGMRSRSTEHRHSDDPFYAHFPTLRTMLRDTLKGRMAKPLTRFVHDDSFLNQWSTDMRYSSGKDIGEKLVDAWKLQARDVVGAIGT